MSLRTTAMVCVSLSAVFPATADVVNVAFNAPQLDRWMYPFNSTPGERPDIPTFGAVGIDGFDDRDGQMNLGFDVAQQVTPYLGPASYTILDAQIIVTTIITSDIDNFIYDPSPDSYRTYLDPDDPEHIPDADAGHPIELFGTAFRNGFTLETIMEDSPYFFGDPVGEEKRSAYPITFVNGAWTDVSNNVANRFEAIPFAIGQADVMPGQFVPPETDLTFDLDVNDPSVMAFLQDALDRGRLILTVATLHNATERGGKGSSFPRFYTKENPLSDFFDYEARLFMTVEVTPQTPAILTGFSIETGALLDGDLGDLTASDDLVVHTRSGFGSTLVDLHQMEMTVHAANQADSPAEVDISVESRIDEPAGIVQIRLFNWLTSQYDLVAQDSIGLDDAVASVEQLDAGLYIDSASDEIRARVKHVVFVPLLAFNFESFVDLVDIAVR